MKDESQQQVPPKNEEVLRAIIKETEGFHGMPQMAKIWELAQIALYQSKLPPPSQPEGHHHETGRIEDMNSSLDRSGSQPVGPFIHSGGEMNKSYYDKQSQPSQPEYDYGQMDEQQYRELTYDERREHDAKVKASQPMQGNALSHYVGILTDPPLTEQGKEEVENLIIEARKNRLLKIIHYHEDEGGSPLYTWEQMLVLMEDYDNKLDKCISKGQYEMLLTGHKHSLEKIKKYDQELATLRSEIQERDNRIKELWTDEQVYAFGGRIYNALAGDYTKEKWVGLDTHFKDFKKIHNK